MDTPNYIKALLVRNGHKPAGRKVWSIDLETIWLPFFMATNVMGETHIACDALGAPLRLAYNTDGTVKFSKTGRPVTKVVKELSDQIRMVRENFTASLASYASGVVAENPEGYKAEAQKAIHAGEPIVVKDRQALEEALAKAVEEAVKEAEAKAEAESKQAEKRKKKELVTA